MYSNPILNSQGNTQPAITQVKQLMAQLKGMQNPQTMLLQQYPQLQSIVSLAQSKGISLQQVAQMVAQQKGYNLNSIINQLNGQ